MVKWSNGKSKRLRRESILCFAFVGVAFARIGWLIWSAPFVKSPNRSLLCSYIGDLNDFQVVVFRKFKDWIFINFENAAHNPWMTDQFLVRFCRARKFDLQKVCDMFSNYMKYRADNNIDTIMGVSNTLI